MEMAGLKRGCQGGWGDGVSFCGGIEVESSREGSLRDLEDAGGKGGALGRAGTRGGGVLQRCQGGRERGMGSDFRHVLQDGWTPLSRSANQGQLEIAQWLLKHGADANAKDKVS